MAEGKSNRMTIVGLVMAAVGLSHFVRPQLFEAITAPAFPKNTRTYIYANGGIETAVGLALANPRTRRAGVLGLLGYLAWLAGNAVRNR